MAESKSAPSLEAVRARIDAIDSELLKLVDERSALAREVAAAKAAAGDAGGFGLRPARETQVLRRLLAARGAAARPALVVRIWRELMADSLSLQGPFHVSVWGGRDPGRAMELTRMRFGAAPQVRQAAKPEEALAAARTRGGVAVAALTPDSAWWTSARCWRTRSPPPRPRPAKPIGSGCAPGARPRSCASSWPGRGPPRGRR